MAKFLIVTAQSLFLIANSQAQPDRSSPPILVLPTPLLGSNRIPTGAAVPGDIPVLPSQQRHQPKMAIYKPSEGVNYQSR